MSHLKSRLQQDRYSRDISPSRGLRKNNSELRLHHPPKDGLYAQDYTQNGSSSNQHQLTKQIQYFTNVQNQTNSHFKKMEMMNHQSDMFEQVVTNLN